MSDVFSRIDHSRTADEVVEQIEGLILEGILRSGERLPGERELALKLDVSRPILRTALKHLEAKGLLVSRHGEGTHVADVTGQVFSRPVMDLIATNAKAVADYLEYRREIEGLAADYAARRATAQDIELLDRIMERMETAHKKADFEEEADIDVEFHHAVGECAHNIVLMHTLRACYRLLSEGVVGNRLMVFNHPGGRDALLAQHRAIHRAVVGRDPAAARKAAMEHIAFIEGWIEDAERTGERERVARLRLSRRAEGAQHG